MIYDTFFLSKFLVFVFERDFFFSRWKSSFWNKKNSFASHVSSSAHLPCSGTLRSLFANALKCPFGSLRLSSDFTSPFQAYSPNHKIWMGWCLSNPNGAQSNLAGHRLDSGTFSSHGSIGFQRVLKTKTFTFSNFPFFQLFKSSIACTNLLISRTDASVCLPSFFLIWSSILVIGPDE